MDVIRPRQTLLFFLSLVLIWASCSKEGKVSGKVLDEAGQPLADVLVKIEGSAIETKTQKDGSYSINYVPGEFDLIFSKDGYIGARLPLKLSEKQRFPAETVRMFRIPEEKEIYLVSASGYQKLARVPVKEKIMETGTFIDKRYHRIFFPQGVPTTIQQRDCTFMDFDPENQILIRLNKRGEIGRLVTIMMGLVESRSFVQVKEVNKKISEGIYERRVSLRPGRYVYVLFVRDSFGNIVPGRYCYYFQMVVKDNIEKE